MEEIDKASDPKNNRCGFYEPKHDTVLQNCSFCCCLALVVLICDKKMRILIQTLHFPPNE